MALVESPSIAAVRKADVGDRTLRQCLREDGSGSDSRTPEFGELAAAKCRERAPGRLFRTSRPLRHHSSIAGLLIPGASPLFSPRGEAKCVRGPFSTRRASLDGRRRTWQSVEHGEQVQRSNGGPIPCFGRQAVRNAG